MEKKELVEFTVEGDQKIFVEIEKSPVGGLREVSRGRNETAAKAQKTFEEAMENLQPMIQVIKSKLDNMTQPAEEVEVKFGVKLSSEVGAILASVGGEVTYEITLKWNNKS